MHAKPQLLTFTLEWLALGDWCRKGHLKLDFAHWFRYKWAIYDLKIAYDKHEIVKRYLVKLAPLNSLCTQLQSYWHRADQLCFMVPTSSGVPGKQGPLPFSISLVWLDPAPTGFEPTKPLGQCWIPPIVTFYNQQGLLRAYSLPGISIRSPHPRTSCGSFGTEFWVVFRWGLHKETDFISKAKSNIR